MEKVVMVCTECGSRNVLADAYAEWDIPSQSWVVQNVMDNGHYCADCDGECGLEEEDYEDT